MMDPIYQYNMYDSKFIVYMYIRSRFLNCAFDKVWRGHGRRTQRVMNRLEYCATFDNFTKAFDYCDQHDWGGVDPDEGPYDLVIFERPGNDVEFPTWVKE